MRDLMAPGIPMASKGRQIPLSARIVALADVYDALVSKRIYKEAYQHDLAKTIIEKERGKDFDPMVVDAFLFCEDKFIEISERFSKESKWFCAPAKDQGRVGKPPWVMEKFDKISKEFLVPARISFKGIGGLFERPFPFSLSS